MVLKIDQIRLFFIHGERRTCILTMYTFIISLARRVVITTKKVQIIFWQFIKKSFLTQNDKTVYTNEPTTTWMYILVYIVNIPDKLGEILISQKSQGQKRML